MKKPLDKGQEDHDPITWVRFWNHLQWERDEFDEMKGRLDALERHQEDNKIWLDGFVEGFMQRVKSITKKEKNK